MAKTAFRPIANGPVTLRGSRRVAANRFVEVYMDDVSFPDGQEGTHVRVREPGGGAVVLVMDEQGRLYLHRAYHYAVNEFCLETIRGFGEPGEPATAAALRELSEEAGFEAKCLGPVERLGVVYPNSTILMNRVPVFLVHVAGAVPREARDARAEGLSDGAWHALDEVEEAVAAGKIRDGFTLSALALLRARERRDASVSAEC